tara:strand:+ start:2918 stop:3682 length:765 start_codon:yes stop_codon:yes gene_type:complete
MLGIGQIATRIAELIRAAMPFAIVSNGTNPDGSSRVMSMFERLIAWTDITMASRAGKNLIIVRDGLYTKQVSIAEDYRLIIGTTNAIIYTNDTHIAWHQTSTSTDVYVMGLQIKGVSGGSGGFRSVQCDGTMNIFFLTHFNTADTTAILLNTSSSQNIFVGCQWYGTIDGGWCLQSSCNMNKFLFNKCWAGGNHGFYIVSSDLNIVIGNSFQGGSLSVQIDSGGTYNVVVGNVMDVAVTNNGGGTNQVSLNAVY